MGGAGELKCLVCSFFVEGEVQAVDEMGQIGDDTRPVPKDFGAQKRSPASDEFKSTHRWT